MPLRVVFFGTAELACATLEALAADPRFQVLAVVTQPDKPRGRDLQVQPSAVKATALKLNLSVLQPRRAREPAFVEEVRALSPDVGVVVAYGQILPQALLDVPPHGFLNVHTSLLPKHRGAAPIQAALLSGDAETGVTIMKMDAGLDTGPILSQLAIPIVPADNSQTLHDRLAQIGADLLIQTLPRYTTGEVQPRPQPEGATYAAKIEKAHGLINWNEPAEIIERKIRAFTPWPGAYTYFEIGGHIRLVKIWKARIEERSGPPGTIVKLDRNEVILACGEKAIAPLEVQMEGRKRMPIHEFLTGQPVTRVCAPPSIGAAKTTAPK
jgi:methionyl-tRNA formyltransferase